MQGTSANNRISVQRRKRAAAEILRRTGPTIPNEGVTSMGDETKIRMQECKKVVEAAGTLLERCLIRFPGPFGRGADHFLRGDYV